MGAGPESTGEAGGAGAAGGEAGCECPTPAADAWEDVGGVARLPEESGCSADERTSSNTPPVALEPTGEGGSSGPWSKPRDEEPPVRGERRSRCDSLTPRPSSPIGGSCVAEPPPDPARPRKGGDCVVPGLFAGRWRGEREAERLRPEGARPRSSGEARGSRIVRLDGCKPPPEPRLRTWVTVTGSCLAPASGSGLRASWRSGEPAGGTVALQGVAAPLTIMPALALVAAGMLAKDASFEGLPSVLACPSIGDASWDEVAIAEAPSKDKCAVLDLGRPANAAAPPGIECPKGFPDTVGSISAGSSLPAGASRLLPLATAPRGAFGALQGREGAPPIPIDAAMAERRSSASRARRRRDDSTDSSSSRPWLSWRPWPAP